MQVEVRTEGHEDAAAVRALTARAFSEAEHSAPPAEADGVPGEASLVGWLRESSAFDGRFSLVAEVGSRIVGHAIATWGEVDGVPVLGVGPVSVEPEMQGQGVGSVLMRELLSRAQEAGESVVVLLGAPAYYERFGFVPASSVGIGGDPEWGDYFQASVLGGGQADVPRGRYEYAEPFSRLG